MSKNDSDATPNEAPVELEIPDGVAEASQSV